MWKTLVKLCCGWFFMMFFHPERFEKMWNPLIWVAFCTTWDLEDVTKVKQDRNFDIRFSVLKFIDEELWSHAFCGKHPCVFPLFFRFMGTQNNWSPGTEPRRNKFNPFPFLSFFLLSFRESFHPKMSTHWQHSRQNVWFLNFWSRDDTFLHQSRLWIGFIPWETVEINSA